MKRIRAEEVQQIRDDLWFWQIHDPSVKTDLSCVAVGLSSGLVFIDPIALAEESLAELCESATPIAIVLTNANHERDTAWFSKHFGIPIFAHPDTRSEHGFQFERVDENVPLLDELEAVHLPGFAPGEIAIAHRKGRAVFVGDALINLTSHGFTPLPAKYCSDAKVARRSLEKLLQFDFDLMTFAHGLPIVSGAKRRLENLLA